MWQGLYDELKDRDFTVIAVAMDHEVEAARPWIEAASPGYPCLIDREHLLAELYGLVNVPQAVWIDEAGRIVRPPETAGAYESFRALDLETMQVPEGAAAMSAEVRKRYLDALRDWAEKGAESRHVLTADEAAARLPQQGEDQARAHVLFRLGLWLGEHGRDDEAEAALAEAARLHPESWTIWRQAAPKDARGLAAGPAFWERVRALGDRPYYAPVELDGMPAWRPGQSWREPDGEA